MHAKVEAVCSQSPEGGGCEGGGGEWTAVGWLSACVQSLRYPPERHL